MKERIIKQRVITYAEYQKLVRRVDKADDEETIVNNILYGLDIEVDFHED